MRFATAFVAAAFVAGSAGAATVHTSLGSFLPNIAAGYYFEDFNSLSLFAPAIAFGPVNGYSFTASGLTGVGDYHHGGESFISTQGYFPGAPQSDDLTITFTGAAVTAFGFNLRENGNDLSQVVGDVTITLSDATVVSLTAATFNDFRGFTSAVAITSFTLHSTTDDMWPGLDNFYVGAMAHPIPLPAAAGLGGLGLLGLPGVRRRR